MLSLKGIIYVLVVQIACVFACFASDQVRLWTVDSMTRISPTEALRNNNHVFLEAAINEWESFQVIATGNSADLSAGKPSLAPFQSNNSLLETEPEIFLQHYVEVTQSSERSALPTGFYPDALIPVSKGKSLPIIQSPEKSINQPFWVDVHIPEETRPGIYTSRFSFQLGPKEISIPITLKVWDFKLPSHPTLQSCFGLDHQRLAEIYAYDRNTAPLNKITRQFEDLLAQHYLSPEGFIGSIDPDTDSSSATLDAPNSPWIGTPADVASHFLEDHRLTTFTIPFWPDWPFSDPLGRDRLSAQTYLSNYISAFSTSQPSSSLIAHCGYIDEPDSLSEYQQAREWGQFYNELEELFEVRLPMLLTEQPQPDQTAFGSLAGSVDIWSVHVSDLWDDIHGTGNRQTQVQLEEGDQIWLYAALVCLSEHWNATHGKPLKLGGGQPPVWLLDYPPLNYRIWSWVAHHYGISGVQYWATVDSRPENDPWRNAATFADETDIYNGDGLLIYPALRELHGFDGPVASLRLKWIRDAFEDHAYLQLLREIQGDAVANQLANQIARNIGDWENDTTALFSVRQQISNLLASK